MTASEARLLTWRARKDKQLAELKRTNYERYRGVAAALCVADEIMSYVADQARTGNGSRFMIDTDMEGTAGMMYLQTLAGFFRVQEFKTAIIYREPRRMEVSW